MNDKITHKVPLVFKSGLAVTFVLSGLTQTQVARGDDAVFQAGNLLVSRVIYDNNPNTVVAGVTLLPPNCVGSACVTATASGTYPLVWNNALVDGSFGIASKIVLDQMSPSGLLINSLEVPNSSQNGVPPTKDQMVGSFSSKSEVALNLSTDGQFVTFMGYLAPINALDVSNSNTPGVVDPTNPVGEQDFRVIAQVDQKGKFRFTKTNAVTGYPPGNNTATGLPWAPGTDGLRNITGRVNGDGTVTIWGVTSTVSGNGDQGADPNKLVVITDTLAATSAGSESFTTVQKAGVLEVLRGVSFTPGTVAY